MYAQRPDVACVGAPLIRPNGQYLHAGYAMEVPGGALSYHQGAMRWGRPYQLTDRAVRNVTGVSAGWMMIRREAFLELGGFDAYVSDLKGAALGMEAIRRGYLNVITPYALAQVRGEIPCLTGAAPEDDLALLARSGPVTERYYSHLMEREKGVMAPDFTRPMPPYGEEADTCGSR